MASRTTKWAKDGFLMKGLNQDQKLYYKYFQQLYYDHRKPTEEMCRVLNITMERAIELRREGGRFENHQRGDCENFKDNLTEDQEVAVNFGKTPIKEKQDVNDEDLDS